MSITHMELTSAGTGADCAECGRASMADTVLVNEHGLVLLRGQSCTECGGRHRVAGQLVPLPRRRSA